MNELEKIPVYQKANNRIKELTNKLRIIAITVLDKHANLVTENFTFQNDMDSSWYSYAMIVDTDSQATLVLNLKFIEYCINNNLLDVLSANDFIFRFESGVPNGF